jgi:Amino acid permease
MSGVGFSTSKRHGNQALRDSLELASLVSPSSPESVGRSSLSSTSLTSSRRISLEADDPLSNENPAVEANRPRHTRTYSVSSAFDFGSNLFPLSQTAAGYAPLGAPSLASLDRHHGLIDDSLEKNKSLTYLNGLSLIVGLMIGSGIFSSPSQVVAHAGSPGASLVVWVVAGLLAWTGAASYAELGGAIPLNGGAQVYLSKIFGELMGFLFTWCAVFVLKPGSAAIISLIFGEYLVRAVVGADSDNINPWINKGVGFSGLLLVTLLNCVSTKLGTRIGDIFMFFKFIALLGVTITGIVVAVTGLSSKGNASQEWKNMNWFEGTSSSISNMAVALYGGLWAFDGWDNVRHFGFYFLFLRYVLVQYVLSLTKKRRIMLQGNLDTPIATCLASSIQLCHSSSCRTCWQMCLISWYSLCQRLKKVTQLLFSSDPKCLAQWEPSS